MAGLTGVCERLRLRIKSCKRQYFLLTNTPAESSTTNLLVDYPGSESLLIPNAFFLACLNS